MITVDPFIAFNRILRDRILCIDPAAGKTYLVGKDFGADSAKWGGAVIIPISLPSSPATTIGPGTAVVLFTPLNARQVLVFDPWTQRSCFGGDDLGLGTFKFDGTCLGADGSAYCAPVSAFQVSYLQLLPC